MTTRHNLEENGYQLPHIIDLTHEDVRYIRQRAGFTQKDIAKIWGLKYGNSYSSYENNKKRKHELIPIKRVRLLIEEINNEYGEGMFEVMYRELQDRKKSG